MEVSLSPADTERDNNRSIPCSDSLEHLVSNYQTLMSSTAPTTPVLDASTTTDCKQQRSRFGSVSSTFQKCRESWGAQLKSRTNPSVRATPPEIDTAQSPSSFVPSQFQPHVKNVSNCGGFSTFQPPTPTPTPTPTPVSYQSPKGYITVGANGASYLCPAYVLNPVSPPGPYTQTHTVSLSGSMKRRLQLSTTDIDPTPLLEAEYSFNDPNVHINTHTGLPRPVSRKVCYVNSLYGAFKASNMDMPGVHSPVPFSSAEYAAMSMSPDRGRRREHENNADGC